MNLHFRSVSVEDVTKIERKLLQTMEMIALKKKKIALAQRDKRERARGRGELFFQIMIQHFVTLVSRRGGWRHLVGQDQVGGSLRP